MKPPPHASKAEPYLEQSVSSDGAQPSAKAIYQQRKHYGKNVAAMGEVSQYKVEHLTTFTMERKEAILTVDDSVRKLQLLDARGKVWTQEIYLNVDDKCLKLIDCDSSDELENFSLTSVVHIQPVINACSYNSICAIVVKDTEQHSTDIHLFQCSTVPADIISADISSAMLDIKTKKGKKSRPDTLRRHREAIAATYRPPSTPPINVKDRVAEWTTTIEAQNEPPSSPRSSLNGVQENNPEILAFRIHRDVQMLNHALDDIEVFVSMLQKSADATKELTVRQSKRKGSKRNKGRASGNGIMELRARLPPKQHFVDCFQKFKFCFNLLAKLKSQIKDPSSEELIHFLFQPLGMIVHTCSGPELARQVKSPMLHQDSIEFIKGCVNPQEMHLWRDLGEFWFKPRNDFPNGMNFPLYVPRFNSGWAPPLIPSMESEDQGLAATIQDQANLVLRTEEAWKAGGANIEDALKPLSPVSPLETSSLPRKQSIYNGVSDPSSAFKQHVKNHVARNQAAQSGPSPPRKLCRAMYDYTARNEHEISVKLDDLLDVMDDSKSWWMVQNEDGETGYVPANLMLLISSASKTPAATSTESPPGFVPSPPGPAKVPVAPPPPPVYATVNKTPSSTKLQPVAMSSAINSVVLKKTSPMNNRPKEPRINAGTLQDELKERVASQKKKNFVLPKKSPSSNALVISTSSPSAQVKHWLRSNGFSTTTVDSLGVLNGAQIFSLKKEELKQICDDEGSRVHSRLLVQRSLSGSQTANAGSELGKIMKKRQQMLEDE